MADTSDLVRDEVAAICVQWEAGHRETTTDWARKYLADCRNEEHFGDCTKAPITCLRCTCDEAFKQADQILAALESAPTMRIEVDGWKMVPVEPTDDMFNAAISWFPASREVWRRMLEAAPSPPVQPQRKNNGCLEAKIEAALLALIESGARPSILVGRERTEIAQAIAKALG